ncbi:MAG: hypothetical protein CSA62_05085 [Planctomycetota bacterium]|nr:MAG: hypothetical protein CSA62_05085 [Planctomycetota bacterium]
MLARDREQPQTFLLKVAGLRKLELVLPGLNLVLPLGGMLGRRECHAEFEWREAAMLDLVTRLDSGQAL